MMGRMLIALILFFCFGIHSFSQGDLLITPKRIVFEGSKQKETLNLANTGKDTATYSISFIQYNMNEDGSFTLIDKPDEGQYFADPFLRIFPRTVKLAPGEPQAIMLQFRRKTDMAEGEYRSHLYFRSEKETEPLGSKTKTDSTQLSVELIPIYGISIPVIIRVGMLSTTSLLSDLKLSKMTEYGQLLNLTINRTGYSSVYGDIIIDFVPEQGKSFRVGEVRGIGVYTNISKRNVAIKLDNSTGKPLTNGKLKVKFISNGDIKPVVYAEAELLVKK